MVPVSEKSRGMAGLRHNLDPRTQMIFSRMYIYILWLFLIGSIIRHTLSLDDSGPHQTCVLQKDLHVSRE